ncbi:MAG: cyclic nucleotide-binding domain-containing protein [Spirochaetaceae bacterium]|jgi:CRP-like cAMP-binding protein|nr:cyclic nucleotide-binding domain-containing protein [Spirochaetaceae bacterium]
MIESSALQKYSLFGGLLDDQIEKILPLMGHEFYEEGSDIIVEGQPNDRIRFILEGRVEVSTHGVVLYEFKEGDVFGEMEILDVMPAAATARALCATQVMSISNTALREIYKIDSTSFAMIIMNLARDLSRRLRHLNQRVLTTEKNLRV